MLNSPFCVSTSLVIIHTTKVAVTVRRQESSSAKLLKIIVIICDLLCDLRETKRQL